MVSHEVLNGFCAMVGGRVKRGHVERLVPHHFAGSICGYCRGDILPCAAIFGDVADVCGVESRDSLFKGGAESVEAHTGGDIDTGHGVIDRARAACAGHVTSPSFCSPPARGASLLLTPHSTPRLRP